MNIVTHGGAPNRVKYTINEWRFQPWKGLTGAREFQRLAARARIADFSLGNFR